MDEKKCRFKVGDLLREYESDNIWEVVYVDHARLRYELRLTSNHDVTAILPESMLDWTDIPF